MPGSQKLSFIELATATVLLVLFIVYVLEWTAVVPPRGGQTSGSTERTYYPTGPPWCQPIITGIHTCRGVGAYCLGGNSAPSDNEQFTILLGSTNSTTPTNDNARNVFWGRSGAPLAPPGARGDTSA